MPCSSCGVFAPVNNGGVLIGPSQANALPSNAVPSYAKACLNCCQGQLATTQFNPCSRALAVAAGVVPCPRVGKPCQNRYIDTNGLVGNGCNRFEVPPQRRQFAQPGAVSRHLPNRGFNPGSCSLPRGGRGW